MSTASGDLHESCPFSRVMEVAMVGVLPMALKAAIELNVMDILAAQPEGCLLSAVQIAGQIQGRTASLEEAASALDRILRVLASHGLLISSSNATIILYGLTPASRLLLQQGAGSSTTTTSSGLAAFVLLVQDPVYWQAYFDFHHAVLHGGTLFAKVHGTTSFSFTQQDSKFDQLFNTAMVGHSYLIMSALLQSSYTGFQAFHSLVDVAGGKGACLSMVTSKYPHIKGINFDLPHVIATAPTYPGVEHKGGDMFEGVPSGEAIFMKWILHDWSDEHCINLLKNCHKSLPSHGKVIALDAILPKQVEKDANARATYHMDLIMLAFNVGGKERTQEEFEALAKAAGFSKLEVVHEVHGMSVMEISK